MKIYHELKNWKIKAVYDFGRITLKDGDKTAREHYQRILDENDELQIELILDLMKRDRDVRDAVEERAAIIGVDDFESAVCCNFR